MPVANDGASAESAAAAGDTPDYASAAGERTVVGGSTQDAPAQQYRPAPEYGAYGPVPTQPADGTAAANDTANGAPNMLRSRNMARTGRLPDSSRSSVAILSSGIRMWVEISRTISRIRNRITQSIHEARCARRCQRAASSAEYSNNGNPFGNPNNGNPFGAPQQNGAATKPKSASGVTGHVMTGVVAALVSAALCLASATRQSPMDG